MSKKKESEKKVGRPTKFNQELSEKIYQLCTKGKTNKEISEIIGVSERTLYFWLNQKPQFLQSLKESKQAADDLVEASLFHKAIGYHGTVPDTTAAIFWLKNRRPEDWRDKQQHEHTGADGESLPATQVFVNIPSNGKEKKDD